MNRTLTWDDFYGLQRFGMTPDLENIQLFCKRLHHPEAAFPSLHIAGTNGKGSVTALLDSILRSSGLKVGMYTSPHILRFEERIRVNGNPISEEQVFDFLERHWDFIRQHRCTFFETATAMAFDLFQQNSIDIAVVEVGLGGTYDATRVVQSILAIITRIDFDHTERLGRTLAEIAWDKAGIFRSTYPGLTIAQQPEVLTVLKNRAQEIGARFYLADNQVTLHLTEHSPRGLSGSATYQRSRPPQTISPWHCPLTGTHQVENVKLALTACRLLRKRYKAITPETIKRGLSEVNWPGRLQEIHQKPYLVVDVGHNPGAIQVALENVRALWQPRRLLVIFSALRDKDVLSMMRHLRDQSDFGFVVALPGSRGLSREEITERAGEVQWEAQSAETVAEAFQEAFKLAQADDVILAIGSHYLVQEVLKNQNFS